MSCALEVVAGHGTVELFGEHAVCAGEAVAGGQGGGHGAAVGDVGTLGHEEVDEGGVVDGEGDERSALVDQDRAVVLGVLGAHEDGVLRDFLFRDLGAGGDFEQVEVAHFGDHHDQSVFRADLHVDWEVLHLVRSVVHFHVFLEFLLSLIN